MGKGFITWEWSELLPVLGEKWPGINSKYFNYSCYSLDISTSMIRKFLLVSYPQMVLFVTQTLFILKVTGSCMFSVWQFSWYGYIWNSGGKSVQCHNPHTIFITVIVWCVLCRQMITNTVLHNVFSWCWDIIPTGKHTSKWTVFKGV